MHKNVAITLIFLYLMLCVAAISYAGPFKDAATLQEHIEAHLSKVKMKNPQKYEEMMQKNRGKVSHCIDCHPEAQDRKLPVNNGIDSGIEFRR